MNDENYRLAFSHLLVTGTTIWCMYNMHTPGDWTWHWINGAYVPICFYSLTGVWRYGNPEYGNDAANVYNFSSQLVQAFVAPCFVTQLLINYGYDAQLSAIAAALSLIPVGIQVAKDEWEQELVDFILAGCLICGTVVSSLQENYFGIVANLNYLINHFVLRRREIAEVPTKVFYNVGLCFFLFYSYKALGESC